MDLGGWRECVGYRSYATEDCSRIELVFQGLLEAGLKSAIGTSTQLID